MPYSKEDIFILAIRRSGNHAVANWFIPHFTGIVRYLNDYVFLEQMRPENNSLEGNPTYLYMTLNGETFCLLNKGQVWTIQEVVAREFVRQLDRKLNPVVRAVCKTKDFENMINEMSVIHATSKLPYWVADDIRLEASANFFGCENQTPRKLAELFSEWNQSAYKRITRANGIETTEKRTFILVLRNPFNNLASLMRKPSLWPPNHITVSQFPETWIAYAREYLGETSYLSALGNVVTLNYDLWFSDQDYRKKLSVKIAKPFTETGLQKVSPNGEGSSFDDLEFSDRAQEMNVLERWKVFQDNEEYLSLLKNDEMLALYERIYGKLPFKL